MNKFLVLYLCPISVLDSWRSTPEAKRKEQEADMQGKWNEWLKAHADQVLETAGAGATKRVTSAGVADARNEIMLYSIVEAASHEEAAKLFVGHPHLAIPEASIEIMAANTLPGMSR